MQRALAQIREISRALHSTDRLLITFWGLLSLFCLIWAGRIPLWWLILPLNAAATVAAAALAAAARGTGSRSLRVLHDWSAFPFVLFTFKELHFIIGPIHSYRDYDTVLISLDRTMFRANPTEWMARFSSPPVTEVLQIAYSLFYVLFIAVGLELYRRRSRAEFDLYRFASVYGFLVSYVGYMLLPAAGPRFALHDFARTDSELPGVLLTHALRWFVNFFESIRPGMSNSEALANAQRDVFPSGHTMMTLITIVLAYRCRLRLRHTVLAVGILLIAATVYLRYHYLIDVLAGILLAAVCLWTARKLSSLMTGRISAA